MALFDRIRYCRLAAVAGAAVATAGVGLAVAVPVSAQEDRAAAGTETPALSLRDREPPAPSSGGGLFRDGTFTGLPDVPGAAATAHTGINNRGRVVGAYADSAGQAHGFLWHPRRGFTTIDPPRSTNTFVFDINDTGQIVGGYTDAATTPDEIGNLPPGSGHGFVRDANGAFRTIDVPHSTLTSVVGINNRGHMVGTYVDRRGVEHGFRLAHGRFTTIDPPDAPDEPGAANTQATDINDRGQIVGFYADDQGTYHGFLRDRGVFTTVDPPGAADVADVATTAPFGINNRGQIVGQYVDDVGVLHGYVRDRRGRYRVIDHPRGNSIAADIDDRGRIVVPAPLSFFKGRVPPVGG